MSRRRTQREGSKRGDMSTFQSPYIAGPPLKTSEMFFGREEDLNWIVQNIGGAYQKNVLVLHGERRVGVTSLLYQLENTSPVLEHFFLRHDLGLHVPHSIGALLYTMALTIGSGLARYQIALPEPDREEFEAYPEDAFFELCETLPDYLGSKVVVLMLDEFDALIKCVQAGPLSKEVLNYLRGIVQEQESLTFIFAGSRLLRGMLRDEEAIYFNVARVHRVGFLTPDDAERLVREPVAGYLTYDEAVVRGIWEATAGHPYLIQCLCDDLFRLAKESGKEFIEPHDLRLALQSIAEGTPDSELDFITRHLSEEERQVLTALAKLTGKQAANVSVEAIGPELESCGATLSAGELSLTLRELVERDLVKEAKDGVRLAYGFKMDLLRLWFQAKAQATTRRA